MTSGCRNWMNTCFKSTWHSLSLHLCLQQKRKLRLYISNTFNPAKPDSEDSEGSIASWELRVEGKLLDDVSENQTSPKSWFFLLSHFTVIICFDLMLQLCMPFLYINVFHVYLDNLIIQWFQPGRCERADMTLRFANTSETLQCLVALVKSERELAAWIFIHLFFSASHAWSL